MLFNSQPATGSNNPVVSIYSFVPNVLYKRDDYEVSKNVSNCKYATLTESGQVIMFSNDGRVMSFYSKSEALTGLCADDRWVRAQDSLVISN